MATQKILTSGPDLWSPLVDPVTEAVELSALEGNDTVTGTVFDDLIFGNQDNDQIDPADGNDIVYAGRGNDTIIASLGDNLLLSNEDDDYIEVSGGNNTVYGGLGGDTLIAVNGNNLLLSNQGDDYIEVRGGNNTAYGGQGNDTIIAQAGNNLLLGNQENDRIEAGSGNDTVYGGQGNDTIVASTGIDVLYGNEADDTFLLASEAMVAEGDVFDGGEGNDRLEVDANNNISDATVTGIETIAIASTATLTATLDNLADVTSLAGNGTIQILATTEAINEYLETLGEGLATTLTIRDQDGNIIQGGSTTDPDDNIPIANTLRVGQDNIVSAGRFDAPVVFRDTIGNIPTLESVDVLEGTGDADILTATMDGTVFGANNTLNVVPRVTGMETINVRAIQNVGFNAINTRGTTTFTSSASAGDLAITNLQELPTDFIARNNSGSLTATIGDSVLSGGDDSVNITLENTNALGEVISIGSINGTQGIETFNIISTGVISNRLDGIFAGVDNSVTTVNISGDNSLELVNPVDPVLPPFTPGVNVLPNSISVLDASGLEGDLTLNQVNFNDDLAITAGTGNLTLIVQGDGGANDNATFTGGTGDVNFTFTGNNLTFTAGTGNVDLNFSAVGNNNLDYVGSEGNVSINMGNNLDDDDAIDGGDGDNSIAANFNANVDPLEINNVQTLLLTVNGVSSISFEDSDNSIELIRLTNQNANPPALSIEAIKSLPAIEFQADGSGTNVIDDPATNSVIFSDITIISTGVSGANDTLTLEVNNQGNLLSSEANARGYEFRGVRADGVENIVLDIADGNLGFDIDPNGDLVDAPNIGNIQARGLKTVTIASTNDVRLGNIANPDGDNTITRIDATGVTGRFEAASADLAANAVVDLGDGISVFDASLTAGNTNNAGVSINGAGGNDTLTGSVGNDSITGGVGDDIIALVAGGTDTVRLNQTATTDTITGFAFNDDIVGLSQGAYNTLSVGQKYDILPTGGVNVNTNLLTTIVQGTEAAIEALAQNVTTRIRFAIVTGFDADADGVNNDTSLFYSATGNFTNLDNADRIADLIGFGGFAAVNGTDFVVPIA